MKYIRTKDGKIWLNKNPNHDKEVYTSRYSPKDITKEADTVKELCEEFVYQVKGGGRFVDDELANKFDVFESVHGAIWTDKGLIYAAKMKGVLPNGEVDWELL